MAVEELAFARKASGMVRGISTFDAFGMGIIAINIVFALWFALALSLGLYPGANLYISLAVCVVVGAASGVLVWGILGGTMPRSGGEYVYNSRILHPAVALGGSFGMVATQCYWGPFVVWTLVDPFLVTLAQIFGWDSWVPFLQSTWGIFVLSVGFQALAIAIITADVA